jgi:RNA polymerase sigma factor (sigma-70 family)
MRENISSPFNPADCWPLATKVVASFVRKNYRGMFTAQDVDDIAADVVTRMWKARATFNPEKGALHAWVWRIAQRAVLDAVNARAKRLGISEDIEKVGGTYPLPIPDYSVDNSLVCDDKVEYYLRELKSERERRFLLYLADGLCAKEIAERESLTPNQVHMAVFHLRQHLKGLTG